MRRATKIRHDISCPSSELAGEGGNLELGAACDQPSTPAVMERRSPVSSL